MQRSYDTRLIRAKRSYTVKAIAKLYSVDPNTVRKWVKDGLKPIDQSRIIVIHGSDLKAFLDKRQAKRKQPCKDGEMYCSKCRKPKRLLLGSFHILPTNTVKLMGKGKCMTCKTSMTRMDVMTNLQKVTALFNYASSTKT